VYFYTSLFCITAELPQSQETLRSGDNKYNMINTIAHEYKHVLDFLRIRSLINYGFNYYKISQYSDKNRELRAIEYQRSHNSYNNTTTKYKKTIDRYESIQK